ncbi:MAG: NAD(P)/FAD-dependent oxidoreductase [Clostridiales bacterium]|nr:NAD(P)/FAD-dependent oxidoreductase [Clostridiales bacterium]
MYDVVIVGAGITGSFITRELSKYNLKIAMIDKSNDVANGTTKANSAIVHAGYDAEEGSLKAKFNVRGNKLYEAICKELHVPFKRIGSLVLAFDDQDIVTIRELYDRGLKNGVEEMMLLEKDEVLRLEENINNDVVGALHAKSAGIVGPWELAIALTENALENGAELHLNCHVKGISKNAKGFELDTTKGLMETKMVVNCAGVHSDDINNMVNENKIEIIPNSGEYNLFDKSMGSFVNSVIFRCPTQAGKGVLVTPTVHGNLLVGPTALNVEDKDGVATTYEGLTFINNLSKETMKEMKFQNVITSFTGIRAKVAGGDFIVGESEESPGFFNVAGIDSPGLTAAPAIAEYVVGQIISTRDRTEIKKDFIHNRRPSIHFMDLSSHEKDALISKDPAFGKIICRCENITEGEIIDIIRREAGATTLDGVKRRARPGSGRCQGGFCASRVIEIFAREQNILITEVVKDNLQSVILTGKTNEAGR